MIETLKEVVFQYRPDRTHNVTSIVNRVVISISGDGSLFGLLVTDQCRANLAVGKQLKIFHKNFLRVTHFAHAVHSLYETIRDKSGKVNKFVANMKRAPSHRKVRKNLDCHLTVNEPLLPTPAVTRCGTFLNAAFHHLKYIEGVKAFISRLKNEATYAKKLKKLI